MDQESFGEFFKKWMKEQNQYLTELISTVKGGGNKDNDGDIVAEALMKRVMEHYEHYYRVKSHWVEKDALGILSPSWISSFEDAFLWLGGWRPTMAFHLLYSKSGLQLEGRLLDLIHGLSTGDLADLSSHQVVKIDTLQRGVVKQEKEITEKMAKYQETIADPSMVELSHMATKFKMETSGGGEQNNRDLSMVEEELKLALAGKEDGLKEVVKMADELRLGTLKQIIGILTSTQRVHFLIAAAELHLRIHEWGLKRDSDQR
ncbi:transcription factor TGA2-like isoform X2 [Cucumis melo var. makuwa]|uniref:Protein DELAY OF GERMINATION 1-like isoform X2 n=2 Tax=Cucumis melo TaxID=3656 RepID=A0A1S3B532_CUCME|nr:protein DELAY OF GERMINATION 1-like isoform X2 [Cucumis melo]KAA0041261.1 transcription factor TGA2-like isoform X2 [Cucumis melo var. makuwa]TYK16060.1 transcription factor TGA2-like isoform X2 [Cucumis melo var. makuwa]